MEQQTCLTIVYAMLAPCQTLTATCLTLLTTPSLTPLNTPRLLTADYCMSHPTDYSISHTRVYLTLLTNACLG